MLHLLAWAYIKAILDWNLLITAIYNYQFHYSSNNLKNCGNFTKEQLILNVFYNEFDKEIISKVPYYILCYW